MHAVSRLRSGGRGRVGTSHRNSSVAVRAPRTWTMTNPGTSSGRIPVNVSVKARATVTAGFANDVEAVNQYADVNGPTGRTVVRLLRDNGIAPTVIELNMEAVRALRHAGIDAIYGDATRPETLGAASIATAGALILGSAGMANSTEVIRMARGLNPEIRVLARA